MDSSTHTARLREGVHVTQTVESVFQGIKYFKPDEEYQQGNRRYASFPAPEKMSRRLMLSLDKARELAGIPFIITSSYRENDELAHGDGEAVDIRAWYGSSKFLIVRAAIDAGFNRIGIYDRHVHLDVSTRLPTNVIWIGKSE